MARKGPKPSYKWIGNAETKVILRAVATPTSGIQLPVPSSAIPEANNDVLFERMFIDHSIRRLTTGSVVAVAAIVALQKVDDVTGIPIEVLDALLTGNAPGLANRDILAIYQIPVPPIILGAGDTLRVSSEVMHVRHDIKVRRRIQRLNHAITLTIVADLDSVVEIRTLSRSLLRIN